MQLIAEHIVGEEMVVDRERSGEQNANRYVDRSVLVFRFDCEKNAFTAFRHYCGNPGCVSEHAIVFLHDLDLDKMEQPDDSLRVEFDLDIAGWRAQGRGEIDGRQQLIIDEFAASATKETKQRFLDDFLETRGIADRFSRFRWPVENIRASKRLSYMDVASEERGILSGGHGFTHGFEYKGTEYEVEDLYCVNPDCDCREVVLTVFHIDRDQKELVDFCDYHLALTGEIIETHPIEGSPETARAVFESFRARHSGMLESFRNRYDRMKALGRRLLDEASQGASAGGAGRLRRKRIGRNDPCPCGSGKKFKKCCGRTE